MPPGQHHSVISFKQTVPHCFRKNKPPDPVGCAGTVLLRLQAAPIPATYCKGVDPQHGRCLPSTQRVMGINTLHGRPVRDTILYYVKTLMTDLHCKRLPNLTGIAKTCLLLNKRGKSHAGTLYPSVGMALSVVAASDVQRLILIYPAPAAVSRRITMAIYAIVSVTEMLAGWKSRMTVCRPGFTRRARRM